MKQEMKDEKDKTIDRDRKMSKLGAQGAEGDKGKSERE